MTTIRSTLPLAPALPKLPAAGPASTPTTAPLTAADTFEGTTPRSAAITPHGPLADLVTSLYQQDLGRAPDAAGLASWTALAQGLQAQGKTTDQIRAAIDAGLKGSAEYRHDQAGEVVNQAFQQLLGRPDTDAADWWHTQAFALSDQGKSLDQITQYVRGGIQGSPEYRHKAAADAVDRVFVALLGRHDTDATDYWHTQVSSMVDQGKSLDAINAFVLEGVAGSSEYRHKAAAEIVDTAFQQLLGRPNTDAGDYWHTQVSSMVDQGKSLDAIKDYVERGIKGSKEYARGHVDADVSKIFSTMLGRADSLDDSWHTHAREEIEQGKCLQQVDAEVMQGIAGSSEYRHRAAAAMVDATFRKLLGRPNTNAGDYWHTQVSKLVDQGKSLESIQAYLTAGIKGSEEYKLGHLDEAVDALYRLLLNRAPDAAGMSHYLAMANHLKAQGKRSGEITLLLAADIMKSPEYRHLHPAPVQPTSPSAGTTRQKILQVAESQIGTLESGDNGGACLKYPNYFGRGSESWCADFVSWTLTQAGVPFNDPYCPSIVNRAKANGTWTHSPQPGDLVLFDWGGDGVADHVGIVKSVNGDGSIQTIEGNSARPGTSQEGVWEHTRYPGSILGYVNV